MENGVLLSVAKFRHNPRRRCWATRLRERASFCHSAAALPLHAGLGGIIAGLRLYSGTCRGTSVALACHSFCSWIIARVIRLAPVNFIVALLLCLFLVYITVFLDILSVIFPSSPSLLITGNNFVNIIVMLALFPTQLSDGFLNIEFLMWIFTHLSFFINLFYFCSPIACS